MIPEINFNQLHFLRPEWFYALIPLLMLALLFLRRKLYSRNWRSVIDPRLLPHVLIGKVGKPGYWAIALFVLTGTLAIISIAGPVWEQLPQQVFKQQSAMVIALDLSSSMNAEDVKPSRLSRAQFKLRDLLALRKEGQTALIVYANAAFTVTPLTDDTNTIMSMVPSLSTDMLPAQGNNTEAALHKSVELMKNSGFTQGDILLISDDLNNSLDIFSSTHQQGYRVSILGVGTADGAPIANKSGDFIKDTQGSIVISKLDTSKFAEAARLGGGRYSSLTTNDNDIAYLLGAADINRLQASNQLTDLKTDTWHEQGPWLLLLVIPLAALAFRKGTIALLIIFILPLPQPAHAISWDELWNNDNQRAAEALSNNDATSAANLFHDPEWKSAANYRAGNYQQAAQSLTGINTTDAHYNRGNALAKSGDINGAIAAYDEALQLNANNEDARFNKTLLEKQKQEQQESSSDDKSDKNKDGDSKDQSGKQQSGNDKNQSDNSQASDKSGESHKNNNNQADAEKSDPKQNAKQDAAAANDKKSDEANKPASNPEQATAAGNNKTPPEGDKQQATARVDDKPDLSKQAAEQWLRKIPDDPGGLLRRKFKHQYQQQSKNAQSNVQGNVQGNDSW